MQRIEKKIIQTKNIKSRMMLLSLLLMPGLLMASPVGKEAARLY
jgi:hypothetical protein